ncbi:protein kinase [Streptomyces sp. NBC_00572]|uniref:protein kinase domain-containing protein n=1 Tax=Streptomyces sp. NBC_00572 TaxID=2903664 RepID=UPI00224DC0F1|nr:protein kinase [Streptomyces sp. NBC_00572]MCX4982461.1 protein kinase [Streptomyces sp. NBC_00572]
MQADGTGAARPGDRIGPYTVLTELAGGGMGRVYVARSPGGRTVAVKTLLAASYGGTVADADRRRFTREVALARRVRGPFTAGVVDADADAPVPWMATEYIPAPSLGELVATQGPLPPAALPWIAAGTVEALISIHSAGLVHRDIKPSNILLPEDGPRVIDFGISQSADLTRTRSALGTLGFVAPEQARGEPTTTASDVFSLGATLFHLATGRSPYRDAGRGTAMEQLVRAAEADLDLKDLPVELEALILPCLDADPARRPTADDLLTRVGPDLAARPRARGATDWLPRGWSAAIEQHRGRRTEQPDTARPPIEPHPPRPRTEPDQPRPPVEHDPTQRNSEPGPPQRHIAPDAAAEFMPHAPTDTLGPASQTPPLPRRRRRGLWIGVALAGLIAAGGVYAAPLLHGNDPGPVRQGLRLALVEHVESGKCADPPSRAYYSEELKSCYRVSDWEAESMSVGQLRQVNAPYDESAGRWKVQMTFDDADTQRFTRLTGRAAQRPAPQNQIAFVLGDRLISAPIIIGAITSSTVDVTGDYTQAEAEALARELGDR